MWFLYRVDPLSTAFNIGGAVELTGALDVGALRAGVDTVVGRHEMLRTSFHELDGEPVQVVAPAAPQPLPLVDLSALAEPRRELERLAAAERRRPFDLSGGRLLRVHLLRTAARHHVALLFLHHIAGDGWSMAILERELGDLYELFACRATVATNAPPPAAPAALHPAVRRLRAVAAPLAGRRRAGPPAGLLAAPARRAAAGAAAADAPAAPRTPNLVSAGERLRVPRREAAALNELSRREGATLFMTLLAAFQALLHRYTGQDDIVVGTNVANRNRTEVEGLIGCFINNLALRTDLSGNPTFRELLRVRDVALDAYAHQDVPFER